MQMYRANVKKLLSKYHFEVIIDSRIDSVKIENHFVH